MLSDKAIVFCVLKVLKKYSDADHIMTEKDIEGKLKTDFALEVKDRRTIYRAIDMLNDSYLGYEISKYEDNGVGYYYIRNTETDLEPSDVQIISDAVCSFPFISEKETKQICSKLQGQLSIHEQNIIKNLTIIKPEIKTTNNEISLNISMLDEAISKKVKVHFDYYDYGTDKEIHKRREKKYTVNPYGMVYCNEHYYLACINCYGTEMGLYRIDLMKNVSLTEYPLDSTDKGFSYKEAVKNALNGFMGENINANMLVDKAVIRNVIDKFGTGIKISDVDEKKCRVRVKTSRGGFVYWALQFIEYVEVVEPADVREQIIKMIRSNLYGI